jgi:hypothetical protein
MLMGLLSGLRVLAALATKLSLTSPLTAVVMFTLPESSMVLLILTPVLVLSTSLRREIMMPSLVN